MRLPLFHPSTIRINALSTSWCRRGIAYCLKYQRKRKRQIIHQLEGNTCVIISNPQVLYESLISKENKIPMRVKLWKELTLIWVSRQVTLRQTYHLLFLRLFSPFKYKNYQIMKIGDHITVSEIALIITLLSKFF